MSRFLKWLSNKVRENANRSEKEEDKSSNNSDSGRNFYHNFERRENKIRKILEEQTADFQELRNLCWKGINDPILRAETWRILLNYEPAQKERRIPTLEKKREEYRSYIVEIYEERDDLNGILTQLDKDMPRTRQDFALFKKQCIQNMMRRILYILAIRNPASSYVQGLNELCVPFITVFLMPNYHCDPKRLSAPIEDPSQDLLLQVEADTYWCLANIMTFMHDFFMHSTPGVQRAMIKIGDVIKRVDPQLSAYMENADVTPISYAFRWVSCFMMREFPLHLGLYVWDAFIADEGGFHGLCGYLGAALVLNWKNELMQKNMSEMLQFLHKVPTQHWDIEEISMLLSRAFYFKSLFDDSPNHLG
ncbi:unnamed protein product [Blepharisma stoltei]|uniref:Rab-GAP TBC domain-containing protein n=1 Tax=Blepharisma stoltei TaxID=1481888 RepID=A0AAU9J287_9CILI|nr:unnamed protein product [Blepharisma stoltei]